MIVDKNSYLDMRAFAVPLRQDNHCSLLHHLDLTIGATSRTSETAFSIISGSSCKPETVLAVHASTAAEAAS